MVPPNELRTTHLAGDAATQLLARAGLLTRVLAKDLRYGLTLSEAGVLRVVEQGPRRVTELAELEGLAQPTMTQLVQGLEGRGFVARERQVDDGRVVLVRVTPEGSEALRAFRAQASARLDEYVAALTREQSEALVIATGALDVLIEHMQTDATR